MNRIKLNKINLKSRSISSEHTLEELRHRILMLHQMMQGIPDKRVDLGTFNSADKPVITCGTNACLLGWAAFYPPAQEWGLKPHHTDGWPSFTDEQSGEVITSTYRTSDRILWNGAFDALFASSYLGVWDSKLHADADRKLGEKELALARLSYAYNKFLIPA